MRVLFAQDFSWKRWVRSVVFVVGPGRVESYGDIIHSPRLFCNDWIRNFPV